MGANKMDKCERWSLNLRLFYIIFVFMYGIVVKFTIVNDFLFAIKTIIPEVTLLAIAGLAILIHGFGMRPYSLVLLGYSLFVFSMNLATHGLTEQGQYAVRDMYIPVVAFSFMMIPFPEDKLNTYTRRSTLFFKFYLIAGLLLAIVEQLKGWKWSSAFYTGYEFYSQDPVSKIKIAHNFGLLRAPSLSGNFATFGYYCLIAAVAVNAYTKSWKEKVFWNLIALSCMVLATNKSAVVVFMVILILRWTVHLRNRSARINNLIVFMIVGFIGISTLLLWLESSETKGVFLSLYQRMEYWIKILLDASVAELIFPYNQFLYGSGAKGGLSFWDNTYLYSLFTQGIIGTILWIYAIQASYKRRMKDNDSSKRQLVYELTIALIVLSLTVNVTQGRGFLAPYLVLLCTGLSSLSSTQIPCKV